MTQMGVILGTAAYMSPEQAKGREADKRSDVWAFGAVLYEMLTGRRAFDGEDMSDTLASVLKSDPDWAHLPSGSSAGDPHAHSPLPDEGSPPARVRHLGREVHPERVGHVGETRAHALLPRPLRRLGRAWRTLWLAAPPRR